MFKFFKTLYSVFTKIICNHLWGFIKKVLTLKINNYWKNKKSVKYNFYILNIIVFYIIFFISILLFSTQRILYIYIFLFFIVLFILNTIMYFSKLYQFGKYTSQIQRFWKRSYLLFWLIEGFLFLFFIFMFYISPGEPASFQDLKLSQTMYCNNTFLDFYLSFFTLLILLYLFNFLLIQKKNNKTYYFRIYFLIIFLIIYLLFFYEFIKFIYTLVAFHSIMWELKTLYYQNSASYLWLSDPNLNNFRVNTYLNLLIFFLKFWHIFLIFLFFQKTFFKYFFSQSISYDELSINYQNIMLCYIFYIFYFLIFSKIYLFVYITIGYFWNNPVTFYSFCENLINAFSIYYFFFMFKSYNLSYGVINFFKLYYSYYIDTIKYIIKKYIFTINHKRIALNYLWFSLFTGLSGVSLATMIRLELAYPGSHFFKGDSIKYLQVITTHGLIMVFFVAVPIVFGFFANFLIPYHIGSKDVAFPRLNSMGFWIFPSGFILLSKVAFLRRQIYKSWDATDVYYWLMERNNLYKTNSNFLNLSENLTYNLIQNEKKIEKFPFISFSEILPNCKFYESIWNFISNKYILNKIKSTYFIECKNSTATMSGWTFITPMSGNLKYTGFGSQDIAILGVIFAGVSTTISFTNLLITRRTLSMPGIQNRKSTMPFLSISLFLTMRMLALIIPVLGAAMIMLELDRHWGTSFFDYTYGGDIILFHHLFWFFGHPEVYVLILPCFGIANMLLPFYNTRRITSKNHLIWASYIMAYMGFLVWGHHMYLIGLDHRSRALYSSITVMIALPAIVKIVNWTLTLLNGAIKWDLALLFIISFFFFFLCGGLTGMWLSHVGLNVYVHDTFYVVAHFHFLFSASVFSSIFAGVYYYFNIVFGVKYNKIFGYLHLFYWFCGQWLTFLPLFWVGYNGLPRRYHDYPLFFSSWQGLSSAGHILTLFSLLFFFLMLLDSHIINKTSYNINLFIPRWHKRINYLLFKIKYQQKFKSNVNFYYFNYFNF